MAGAAGRGRRGGEVAGAGRGGAGQAGAGWGMACVTKGRGGCKYQPMLDQIKGVLTNQKGRAPKRTHTYTPLPFPVLTRT